MDVVDNIAIVTGAAGGMGSAIARALALEKRRLVLSDFNADTLQALAVTLQNEAPVALVAGDVTHPDYPAQIKRAIGSGRVDLLAHAAGVSPLMADGRRIFEINFAATRRLVEADLPAMEAGGTIVLIASNSGQLLFHRLSTGRSGSFSEASGRSSLIACSPAPAPAYPLSKHAVQLYAQAASPDCGKAGVRIVSLSSGIIDTDMGRLEQGAGPEMDKMIALTPLGRMGTADEIA